MIKVQKDNAMLSIKEEDLAQYEARGYKKLGDIEKIVPSELKKEVDKLKKEIEKLTSDNEELTKTNEKLTKDIEELKKNVK